MIKRIGSMKVLHHAVVANGTVYTAGTIADDLDLGMEGQTREICQKLDELLASAGSDKTKILSAQIFLTDIAAKEDMNTAWTEWLSPEILPARATIGITSLGNPKILVEVVITAAV